MTVCVPVCLSVYMRRQKHGVVFSVDITKAARACDLRWFCPPLVDLTTENDSRIERIVRYDQDSDGDKMYKTEKRMRPQ